MALSATFYPSADAWYLTGGIGSDINHGTETKLLVGEPDNGDGDRRVVIKFDLSSISSATVVVTGVTLTFYQYDDHSAKTTYVKVHRNTGNWSETGVNGNNEPPYNEWCGQFGIGDGHRGDISASLNTGYLQNWLRGSWPNYGYHLFTELGDNDQVVFYSREYSTVSRRPRLVVSYYDVPVISTNPVYDIGTSKSIFSGNISSVMGYNCSVRGFQYGLSQTPTWSISESGNFGAGVYYLTATGLYSSRNYYYRAFATNPAGTVYGSWVSFKMAGLYCGMV